MSERKNEEWIVSRLSVGTPEEKDWALKSCDIPELKEGELLLQPKFISVDPYLRSQSENDLNKPQCSMTVAEVLDSKNHKSFKKGDFVCAILPWRRFIVTHGDPASFMRKVEPMQGVSLSINLGIFGVTGMTAYWGLMDVASLKDKETVVISGAAGAVGIIAGQIAKLKGCRVVGVAGGADKCKLLTEKFKFDAAIDYKSVTTHEAMKEALSKAITYTTTVDGKEVTKTGIDVYFENTGGVVTDVVFELVNKFARVAVCGQISTYNSTEKSKIINFLPKIIYKAVNVRGFGVADFMPRVMEFFKDMSGWVQSGKVLNHETVFNGFDQLPTAQIGLFSGKNSGKAVVKV